MPSRGKKSCLSRAVILALALFLALAPHSASANAFTALKDNLDITTITPTVTGVVLFDLKKQVRTHPGSFLFIIRNRDSFAHMYSPLVIDLGITYTSAMYVKDGKVYYVTDEHGQVLTPSYISFVNGPSDNNTAMQILVGQKAKAQCAINPENTIFNWQRLVRLRYGDPIVQSEINHRRIPYKIVSSVPTPPPLTTPPTPDGHPTEPTQPQPLGTKNNQHFLGLAMIQVTDIHNQTHLYRPEELTAILVSKIKERAESQSGTTFKYAYVMVPSDYTEHQRWALQEAIAATGLDPFRMISRYHVPAVGYTAGKELEGEEVYVLLLVNLDPECIEVAVAELEDHMFDMLGFVEQPASIQFDDELANRPVVEFLIDQHVNRSTRNINGQLRERTAQHVMGHLSTGPEDTLFHRNAILSDPIAMKRLQNEVHKVNSVFFRIYPSPPRPSSASGNFVRIEIEALFDDQDFSELLSLSRWQELRQAALEPILLETMEQAFKIGSIGQNTVNMIIVAGASPLVPDAVRLLKQHFHGQNVDIPLLPNPALATLEGMKAIVDKYAAPLGFEPCMDNG